jgi:uncharacterized protein
MKKYLIIILLLISYYLLGNAWGADVKFPAYVGYVNDFAGVMDAATVQKIQALCKELEAKTSAELAVVTVKTIAPLDIETYGVKLFEKWGIGKKDKDNGILFILAVEERKVRIEVGYGLEGVINDALAGQIMDENVIPAFKQNKFGEGLLNGAAAIAQKIIKGEPAPVPSGSESERFDDWLLPIIITSIALIMVLSIFASGLASGLFGALFGFIMGYIFAEMIGGIIGAVIGFVLSYVRFPGSGSFSGGGWSGGGGWSSGGSSGGSSFGGGSSGGGGSSRSF